MISLTIGYSDNLVEQLDCNSLLEAVERVVSLKALEPRFSSYVIAGTNSDKVCHHRASEKAKEASLSLGIPR